MVCNNWSTAAVQALLALLCFCAVFGEGKPTKQKMYAGNCSSTSEKWTPGNGSYCYILEEDRLDLFAASRRCFTYASQLTSIHSISEIENIKSLMKPGIKSVFIGLYNNWKGGFMWTDNSPVDFTNWDEVPDSSSGDPCVEMMADTMKWRVASCTAKKYFICRDIKDTYFYGDPATEIETHGKPTKPNMYTGNCPETSKKWIPGNGSYCYILEEDRLDFFAASRRCFTYASLLTSIHSMGEIEDMKSLMKPGIRSVFIGLYRNSKGGFRWTDHTPVDFANWDEVPDNSSGDPCVEMMADTMKWRVAPCAAKKNFICQYFKGVAENQHIHLNLFDTKFYGDPETAKDTHGSSGRLSSGSLAAIIIFGSIFFVIVKLSVAYCRKVISGKIRNCFQAPSTLSFENDLYNVNSSNPSRF